MNKDFPGRIAGPIDENGRADGPETRDHDQEGTIGEAERHALTDALDSFEAVQALIDLEQEDRLLERACAWARREDRRETSNHALRYVLMGKLAEDLGAPGDTPRTR